MPPAPVVVSVECGSDGAETNWGGDGMNPVDDTLYRTKLAQRWMQDSGEAQAGVKYILSALPAGYRLYGKARAGTTHVDRYVHGNPNYRYRSSEEFYPHFRNLMQTGTAEGCECLACGGKRIKRPRLSMPRGTPVAKRRGPGRPPGSLSDVVATEDLMPDLARHRNTFKDAKRQEDQAGNPDVYTMLITQLKKAGELDVPITQLDSFDWLMSRSLVKQFVADIKSRPRFLPRLGEIVLFSRDIGEKHFIAFDDRSSRCRLFDPESGDFAQVEPQWEAGVITQVPKRDTMLSVTDLAVGSAEHKQSSTDTLYRIEPMSQVGSDDKQWSKRACQVSLHQTRPFDMLVELMGPDEETYHPTVMYAMSIASTFCVYNPCHFRGRWPTATVFTRGLYLGPQLICVGDIVRLLPDADKDRVQDVLHITSLKTKFVNLEGMSETFAEVEEDDDQATGLRYHETCLHIAGIAYTLDPEKSYDGSIAHPGLGLEEYGTWYHLHDPKKRWEVPFTRLLSRCYEQQAMSRLVEGPQPVAGKHTANKAFHMGLAAMRRSRIYSTRTDRRIAKDKTWFWADTRVEQLDLHAVNGIAVVDEEDEVQQSRDSRAWLRAVRRRARGNDHRAIADDTGVKQTQASNAMVSADAIDIDFDMKEHLVAMDDSIARNGDNISSNGHKQNGLRPVVAIS